MEQIAQDTEKEHFSIQEEIKETNEEENEDVEEDNYRD